MVSASVQLIRRVDIPEIQNVDYVTVLLLPESRVAVDGQERGISHRSHANHHLHGVTGNLHPVFLERPEVVDRERRAHHGADQPLESAS